jgi:hypothetical protein
MFQGLLDLPRCSVHEHRRCSRMLDQGRLGQLAREDLRCAGMDKPPKRSAISWILSGRKVPSVSIPRQ